MKRKIYQPLELQRLLSGMRAEFPAGRSWRRAERNAAQRAALNHFLGGCKRGRPSFAALADRNQMKFNFYA